MMGAMSQPQDRPRAVRFAIARRGELDLTQAELAEKAGVDPKTISNFEKGERWPQTKNRARIERALGWTNGALEVIAAGGEPGRVIEIGQATETNTAQPVRPGRWQDHEEPPALQDEYERLIWERSASREQFDDLLVGYREHLLDTAKRAREEHQRRREDRGSA